MPRSILITGATGFVGGHVAEACVARGERVLTLARATSDTTLLNRLGVKILQGELSDTHLIGEAVDQTDVVVHCAARVGDWGPVEEYRQVNVEGLRILLEACRQSRRQRIVLLSSLGVYAARHHHGTDETEPLPDRHMDGYTQSKVEAERLAITYHREHDVPVVVLRPGFIYGPRDRTVLPRIVESLRKGEMRYVGGGQAAMNSIFVRNLVDAVMLAVDDAGGAGQVYNLTDGERVSKRQFIEAIAEGLGLPKPTSSVPLWLARILAHFMERKARKANSAHAPRLTQARLKFLGLNLEFSIAKARRELGYQPRVLFAQGIRETLDWYRSQVKDERQTGTIDSKPGGVQREVGAASGAPSG